MKGRMRNICPHLYIGKFYCPSYNYDCGCCLAQKSHTWCALEMVLTIEGRSHHIEYDGFYMAYGQCEISCVFGEFPQVG